MINSTEKKYYTLYKMFDKVSSKVGSTIGSNKKVIQMLLTVLLLLQFAPFEVLGSDVNKKLQSVMNPVLNPVTNLMSNVYIRLLLFIVLVWSCCVLKDMNTFFLIAIYFIVSK
jgi:hypothetical protein